MQWTIYCLLPLLPWGLHGNVGVGHLAGRRSGAGCRLSVAGGWLFSLCVATGVLAHCISCWSLSRPYDASSPLPLPCPNLGDPSGQGQDTPASLCGKEYVLKTGNLQRFFCTTWDIRALKGVGQGSFWPCLSASTQSCPASIFACTVSSYWSGHYAWLSLSRVPESKQAHLLHYCYNSFQLVSWPLPCSPTVYSQKEPRRIVS